MPPLIRREVIDSLVTLLIACSAGLSLNPALSGHGILLSVLTLCLIRREAIARATFYLTLFFSLSLLNVLFLEIT